MTDWENFSWMKRSRQRQKILKLLKNPKTPTDIADELELQHSGASRSLRNMEYNQFLKEIKVG